MNIEFIKIDEGYVYTLTCMNIIRRDLSGGTCLYSKNEIKHD